MVKGIISAVIGDMCGSSREFKSVSTLRFKTFDSRSTFTDDSVLTMAVAEWMLDREHVSMEDALLKWGREYPGAGYGHGFKAFLKTGKRNPEGSGANGSAMRVSPVGYLAGSLDECLVLARESALPSHDTPTGITGAQACAAAIYLARTGSSKEDIRAFIEERFGFDLSLSYEQARCRQQERLTRRASNDADVRHKAHRELMACDLTVTDALIVFLACDSYEQTIRHAVWLGGDSDTLAAIAGSIAGAYWGVPEDLCRYAVSQLPADMIELINRVDGTCWTPSGITPKNTRRWRRNDYVVYGTDLAGTSGEDGFADVTPGRFNRNPNSGYPIWTIGASIEQIAAQVDTLVEHAKTNPDNRYLVRELGTVKAGYTVGQMVPLFREAADVPNILLPESFVR